MPRGKATVQLYNATMRDPPRILVQSGDGDVAEAVKLPQTSERTGDSELSEHIVGQLRVAYDELLNAPIPDHLQKLLTNLLDQEGKS
jgi:anti-sigma factor NepR-like protein